MDNQSAKGLSFRVSDDPEDPEEQNGLFASEFTMEGNGKVPI